MIMNERKCIVCSHPMAETDVRCGVCGFFHPRAFPESGEDLKKLLQQEAVRYREAYYPERSVGLTVSMYSWDEQMKELTEEEKTDVRIVDLPRYELPEDILWGKMVFDFVPGAGRLFLHVFLSEQGEKRYLDIEMPAPEAGKNIEAGVKIVDRHYLRIALRGEKDPVVSQPILYNNTVIQ